LIVRESTVACTSSAVAVALGRPPVPLFIQARTATGVLWVTPEMASSLSSASVWGRDGEAEKHSRLVPSSMVDAPPPASGVGLTGACRQITSALLNMTET